MEGNGCSRVAGAMLSSIRGSFGVEISAFTGFSETPIFSPPFASFLGSFRGYKLSAQESQSW